MPTLIRWIEWNEPLFTDSAPFCNTLRRILPEDAVAYMKRVHPMQPGDDQELAEAFKFLNLAWDAQYPEE